MSLYQTCLARIRQSVTDLTMPPIGLLPVMLAERKQASDKALHSFDHQQDVQAQLGEEAMARIVLRHKPILTTHHTDFRQAIAQLDKE